MASLNMELQQAAFIIHTEIADLFFTVEDSKVAGHRDKSSKPHAIQRPRCEVHVVSLHRRQDLYRFHSFDTHFCFSLVFGDADVSGSLQQFWCQRVKWILLVDTQVVQRDSI